MGPAEATGMAALAPQVLAGRFELLELAGRGGMGEVFRARDRRRGTIVAVKRLAPDLAAEERMRERFAHEAEALAAISTRGVPRLVAQSTLRTPFIVMEWVGGRPLGMLAVEGVPAPRAVATIVELLEVVDGIHRSGWVHGDINPNNVLVGSDDRVALIDLGLARHPEVDDGSFIVDEVYGTPQYMAPELMRRAPVSVATDIYAVGALLRALLGARPGAADAVIRRALAVDPEARFSGAREMREALLACARPSRLELIRALATRHKEVQ